MASVKLTSSVADSLHPYLDGVAKNLADRIWGPDGPAWGTKLTTLEDLVLEIREALSQKVLDLALQRQADAPAERPAEFRECPSCQRPPEPGEPEPRLMTTRAGEIHWNEPHSYCHRCRRSFSPSNPKPGH